ncbi:MAG: ATP-dependent Clp protease adapter ClpS [Gammaproteobacteria bacterium]|nr:ATP-dependent Clp protease adapter ClpS [Gammaproteobacteria bacterium]NNC98175.1 ATP-dependent Clp protease adapter ClpS [Gammaproteobacteria bacterium]NNM13275.1 ATP-dependent Clp protease adapter ClpS [Gammaproteobacteria bacterium]
MKSNVIRLNQGNPDNPQIDDGDNGVGVLVAPSKPKTQKPPMYNVVLLNDDYTPMEFVVSILESFFNKDPITSTRIMLEVHTKGKGVCGVYPFDIANTKVNQVNQFSRQNQHPLMCDMEKA